MNRLPQAMLQKRCWTVHSNAGRGLHIPSSSGTDFSTATGTRLQL